MAITRAQQARQLYIKGGQVFPDGRRGFGGGADMGTVSTYDSSTGKGRKAGPGTGGYQGGPKGGYGDAGRDDKPSKEIRDKQKKNYEKQFYDKGKVPPLGSRPTSFKQRLDQRNKQKRLNYINRLINARRNKISKGLFDIENMPGVDLEETEDYFGFAPSVQDLVDKGFYKSDGQFAKGEKIPDFPSTDLPGMLGIAQDIFAGPVTSDKLEQLNQQIKDLEALKTTEGLEGTTFNELMETYEPNRFKLMNPEQGGRDDDPILPIIPKEEDEETPEDPKQILTTRILGSQFDPTFFAADGGIMNADIVGGFADGSMDEMGRQMYGLGKLVKKATRAVKKIVKSPVGKAAILGGMAYFGGGGGLPKFLGGKGLGGFSTKTLFSSKNPLLFTDGKLSFAKTMGLSAILPLLAGQSDEEKDKFLQDYYAQKLEPGTTKRQMGSEFDFYNYNLAEGGMPSKEPVAKKTMPLIDMGGKEKDYRETGGFVDMGRMERADDVPARLSKNEFVFTADAVRNAGDGDIDKGAEVMYNMMKNLEAGGDVSEESQGLEGARKMFQTSQRLGEVL